MIAAEYRTKLPPRSVQTQTFMRQLIKRLCVQRVCENADLDTESFY